MVSPIAALISNCPRPPLPLLPGAQPAREHALRQAAGVPSALTSFLLPSRAHSFRSSKNSDARLVALLPQLEVRDSFNVQLSPEGMQLFRLPFMDDIRCAPPSRCTLPPAPLPRDPKEAIASFTSLLPPSASFPCALPALLSLYSYCPPCPPPSGAPKKRCQWWAIR